MRYRAGFVRVLVSAAVIVVGGCGYRPLASHDTTGGAGPRLVVVAGPAHVPSARTADALVGAVTMRLAEAGEVRGGEGYPRVEVDLVRIDETVEGLAATGDTPLSRGLRVTVVGRARVVRAAGEPPALDTGDVGAHVTVTAGGTTASALVLRDEASVGAARLLGRRLAERILGLPAPTDEGRGSDF